MNVAYRLVQHTPHRARILGVASDSRAAPALRRWLERREEVIHLSAPRRAADAWQVEFCDLEERPGAFLRALREQLALLAQTPPPVYSAQVVHSLPGRLRLRLTGVAPAELGRLAAWVNALPGVMEVEIGAHSGTLLIRYHEQALSGARLHHAIRTTDPSQWPQEALPQPRVRWGKPLYDTCLLAGALTGALPTPALVPLLVVAAWRPLQRTFADLKHERVGIDLLDVIATGAALATGQTGTAAFIVWMVGVGDLLLDLSSDQARRALAALMHVEEGRAFRLRDDGSTEEVALEALEPGDRIVIGPGQRIAADGKVTRGEANVDEKMLTGEALPRAKHVGDSVLASTVVLEGQVVVEVERAGLNTEAAKVARILETAGHKPLTLQRQALEIAAKFVPPTFGAAGLAALLSRDFNRALSVLITDFGTGIRIAVPTSALTAMTVAARRGILFKGAHYLERLAKADLIVFDKTGTLTSGSPEVTEINPVGSVTKLELLYLAASAEARHDHPIARALRQRAAREGLTLSTPEPGSEHYAIGYGLAARVDASDLLVGCRRWMERHGVAMDVLTERLEDLPHRGISPLFIAQDGQLIGMIGYTDALRPESAELVRRLKSGGRRRVVLLSGDIRVSVMSAARAAGIDEAHGGLLPHEKAEHVDRFRQQGYTVAMVGDGINDAPALARADVGISVAGGTDVAIETADIVLLEEGLVQLAEAFAIADQAMANVRRGLRLVIVPNGAATVLGALGFMGPGTAAIISNGATLAAVLAGLTPLWWHADPLRPAAPPPYDELAARRRIHRSSWLAATLGAIASPLPLLDELILFFIYINLWHRLGTEHGLSWQRLPWRRGLPAIGEGLALRGLAMLPVSWVPGLAAVTSSATAAVLTETLGPYLEQLCRDPEGPAVWDARGLRKRLRGIVGRAQERRPSRRRRLS
jgi:heavy metal translocating P-type ATPase